MIRYLVSILFIAGVCFSCKKEKSFEQGLPALGSLQDSLGNCMDKSVSGNYVAGKTLTDSNYIDVSVFVQTKGTYSVYTDTVNGYYFKGTGNFSSTGQNTIRLKGVGKPVSSGTDDFMILFDSSLCPVSITVTDTASGTGGGTGSSSDHFILTNNSYWVYNNVVDSLHPGVDSIKRINSFQGNLNGTVYQAFVDSDFTAPMDTLLFRKLVNDYYENNWTDAYSGVTFDVPQRADINFLKENIATGQSWNTPDFSGTINGNPTKIHYVFNCSNSNATVSYNGQTYNNVYQVTMKTFFSIQGSPFTDEGILITRYFAKGVGMIYEEIDFNSRVYEQREIKYYKVY